MPCIICGNENTRANNLCKKCYRKKYYKEHKEQIDVYSKQYNIDHKEQIEQRHVCRELTQHHEDMKDDPNSMSTAFMQSIIWGKKVSD